MLNHDNSNELSDDEIVDFEGILIDEENNNNFNSNIIEEKEIPNNQGEIETNLNNNNNNLDLESIAKDDLINILLQTDEAPLQKKKIFKNNPKNKQTELKDIFINTKEMSNMKDPELSQDFNVAVNKILTKMTKETNKFDQEVVEILIDRDKVIGEELRKLEITKGSHIEEKVKNWFEKKNKKIEVIQDKLDEDFHKVCTFAPNLVKSNINKRNLEKFLEDQGNFQKKIQDKIDILREEKIKETSNLHRSTPKINETSKRILESKNNDNAINTKKVHQRLYEKKNETRSSNIELSPKPTNNNIKRAAERSNLLYQDAAKRDIRRKEIQNLNQNKESNFKSLHTSNKYYFNKFKNSFRNEIQNTLKENNHNEENIDLKISLDEFVIVLMNLKFVSTNFYDHDEENEDIEDYSLSTKSQEKKLIIEIFNNLKKSDEMIRINYLFIFCLSVLNLLEYYILKNHNNDSNSQNHIIKNEESKNKKLNNNGLNRQNSYSSINEDSYCNLVNELNNELNSKIKQSRKYGGFDEDENFIISFSHAKLIQKDFNLFASNYNNLSNRNCSKKDKVEEHSFKPKINTNSELLSQEFKKKVIKQLQLNNGSDKNVIKSRDFYSPINRLLSPNNKNSVIEFSDMMVLKKLKNEKLNEKLREENKNKELEKCTFKPKINNYKFKDNIVSVDNFKKEQRLEILYKKGTANIMNKKNKNKDDIEIEKFHRECTFKPIINNHITDFESTDINNEDIKKFNERMRKGRIEREIKESSIFRRAEDIKWSTEIIDNKRPKSGTKEFNQNNQNFKNIANNDSIKLSQNINKEIYEKQKTPVLIIDVNISPGEKRQIIVHEGDCAEKLAENFIIENNLDEKAKLRLVSLIQPQISKKLNGI